MSSFIPHIKTEWSPASSESSCVSKNLFPSLNQQVIKPRKRRSEAGLKSPKKIKNKCSSIVSNEEQILDNDLLGIVKSLNTDRNLDSDSSAETIILDDADNDIPNHIISTDSRNRLEKDISHTSAAVNSSLSLFSYSKQDLALGKKNFEKSEQSKISDSDFSKTDASELKKALTLPLVNFPEVSSTQNVLPNSTVIKKGSKICLKTDTTKKKPKRKLTKTSSSNKESSINLINSVLSNSNIDNQRMRFQNDYASMGLDEDLCDIDNKTCVKTFNIVSKVPCKDISDPLNVPVKVEKVDISYNSIIIQNDSPCFNDPLHKVVVDMQFEVEAAQSQSEDEEDNLPLSLLKDKELGCEMNSASEHQFTHVSSTDNSVDFHPSLFIKKELIENEIVSESQAISSKNLESVSHTINNNFCPPDFSATSQIDLTNRKVKTEPVAEEFLPFDSFINNRSLTSGVHCKQAPFSQVANSAMSPEKNLRANNMFPVPNKSTARKSVNSSLTGNNVSKLKDSQLSVLNALVENERDSQKSNENLNSPKISRTKAARTKTRAKKTTKPEKEAASQNIVNCDLISLNVLDKNSNIEKDCNQDADSDLLDQMNKEEGKMSSIDENKPITSLFKLANSNSSSPNSFVSTDISNSTNKHSDSTVGIAQEYHENSTATIARNNASGNFGFKDTASSSPSSNENKKKKNRKKKPTKKKIQKDAVRNKESGVTTLFGSESETVELSHNLLSDSQSSSVSNLYLAEESVSTPNSQSDLNTNDTSSKSKSSAFDSALERSPRSVVKKRKKRQSNRWSKKKKPKTQPIIENILIPEPTTKENPKTPPIVENILIPEPVPKKSAQDSIQTFPKVPVVIIKNLMPGLRTGKDNVESYFYSIQKPTGGSNKKGKAKKRKKSSNKKSPVQINKNSSSNDSLLDNSVGDLNENLENCEQVKNNESLILEKSSSGFPTNEMSEHEISKSIAEKSITSPNADTSKNFALSNSDQNNINAPESENNYPTVDIAEMRKEIAAYEAMVQVSARKELDGCKEVIKDTCASQTSEINSSSSIKLQEFNALKSSILSKSGAHNAQLLSNIQIKQEIIEDRSKSSSIVEDSSKNSSNATVISGSNVAMKAANVSLFDVTCIKTEQNAEEQSADKSTSDSVFNTSYANSKTAVSLDGKINSQTTDNNSFELSIKKEINDNLKSVHSSSYSIKNQNDLIQKVCGNHKTNSACSVLKQPDTHPSQFQKNSTADENEDEIQILPIEKTKNVFCVDLTEDIDQTNLHENTIKNTSHLHSLKVNDLIKSNTAVKINDSISKDSYTSASNNVPSKQNCSLAEKNTVSKMGKIKSEKGLSPSDHLNEVMDQNINNKVKCDSFIAKGKYNDKYFRHPFPPSMVSCNKKQRKRNECYSRIESKEWNLTIDKVKSRLKHSECVMPQFGQKLGDIIKLEKFPVSSSEIECYHRILGVAPSHKLLFKCFSPKKFSTNIKKDIEALTSLAQENTNENKTETLENIVNPVTCSLSDIIQGITETRMMYSDVSSKDNLTFYDRDCPSTDTRDSFDSYVSNASNKSYNVLQNKSIRTSSNLIVVKENEIDSRSKDACSSGRNSALSCATPDYNDSFKNDISNTDFSTNMLAESFCKSNECQKISSLQRNSLTNFILPQSVISTFNTNDSNLLFAGTSNITCNSLISRNNAEICSSSSLSGSFEKKSSIVSDITNDKSKCSLDIKSFDVAELRKILVTARTLNSETVDHNQENSGMWKSVTTYEYNHTQSVPEADKFHNTQNIDSLLYPDKNLSALPSSPIHSNSKINADLPHFTKENEYENSDDDYVDVEPVEHNDIDEDEEEDMPNTNAKETDEEDSPHEKAQEKDEPVNVPKYKTRWQKIMERKSLEGKEKEMLNEQDCFPVSKRGRTSNKKRNSSINNTLKSDAEGAELNTEGKNDKSKIPTSKVAKQSVSKSKQKTKKNKMDKNVEKKDTDATSSKKTEQLKDKVEEKNSTKASQNINKDCDNAAELFVPDKLIKIPKKNAMDSKFNKNNKSNRCYGNRVTNRGTFLTETKSSQLMKSIKIPKKKTEITKKLTNVRPEEIHSLVKSPEININSVSNANNNKSFDSYKNREFYKSPLSDNSTSMASHFIRTKRMRDKQFNFRNSQYMNHGTFQRRTFSTNQSSTQPYAKNKTFQDRRGPILGTPLNASHLDKESTFNRKIPLLENPHAIPSLGNQINPNRKPLLEPPCAISSPYGNDKSALIQNPVRYDSPSSSSQLPMNPLSSVTDPQVAMLQKIISLIQNPISNSVSNLGNNMLPVPEQMNNSWDNKSVSSLVPGMYESEAGQDKNTLSNKSISDVYGNVHQPELLDPRKLALRNKFASTSSINNQLDLSIEANSPNLNSPLFTPPLNSFNRISMQTSSKVSCLIPEQLTSLVGPIKNHLDPSINANSPKFSPPLTPVDQIVTSSSRKASCLVPDHLKSSVGRETIETQNVRLLMLEWNVDWLMQQQQFQDPPPICKILKKVARSYESFEDYYNTYFPLMLLDTWERIYVSWTHLNQTSPYSCQIASYSVKNHYVSVECQTVFNTDAHPKGVFPDEGSILMIKYSTKSNDYCLKILGYVTHVKTRHFNSVTDSKIFSSLSSQKVVKPEALQILTLTFMGAYNSEDIDKRQPIRIHVLCNVKPTLKQNDAMLHINKSPLQKSILNPIVDGLRSLKLIARNSSSEEVNDCVRDITKGILSPHPLPLLTVVCAKPESDRLNIIPQLIEKMKITYKTKVLLCVRTVRALGDIAANICLNQSLKLVIINKRCDTNPQFQKYLLDELAGAELRKAEDKPGEKVHVKNEVYLKIKKQILSEGDVVLSLIRNSHDDFLYDTFIEKECIAQMCCIIDEANLCTEPETLIPILHGVSKLILIGDPDYSAKVLSKTAGVYDYNKSFFQRAYELDKLEDQML